jgi:hypothetical protein
MANTTKSTTKPTVKKVKIRLPLTKTDFEDVWVAVNGRKFQIKRGVTVEVPEFVAKALQYQEEALQDALEFEAKVSENTDN